MLPLFRILPIGGVLLAVAILLLALHPPRETAPSLIPALLAARGPLLDRDEQPEKRQLLILAALDRADAVERLRAIPDTHIPPAPPTPEPQAGLSLMTPVPATLSPPQAAPFVASAPEAKASVPEKAKAAPQATTTDNPPIVRSAVAENAVAPAPPAIPVAEAPAPAMPAKTADIKPPAVMVAALPPPRPSNDNSAITTASTGADASIVPNDIRVVLPQERPSTLRRFDHRPLHEARTRSRHTPKPRQKANSQHAAMRHHKPAHASIRSAHRTRPTTRRPVKTREQPATENSFDLFSAMFGTPPTVENRKGRP